MAGGTCWGSVHLRSRVSSRAEGPTDGKRRLIRGEGLVTRIRNDYRPQHPVVGNDIPEPAVPYYGGTARLEEPEDTRTRSMGRVVRRPYPDSEESGDDVIYAEEYESELQQINLRNEALNQITVDTCGERCEQLDDFNWFLLTDEWNEKSDTPESEIDTSDSGNGVHVNASDSSKRRHSGCEAPLWSLRRDLKGAVRQQCPGECAATECPDGGQYFSGGYKTGIRRLKYS